MAIFDDLPLDPIFNYLEPRDLIKLQINSKFKRHCHYFFGRNIGCKDYKEGIQRIRALSPPLQQLVLDLTYSITFAEKIALIDCSPSNLKEALLNLGLDKIKGRASIEVNSQHLELLKEGLVPLQSLISILQKDSERKEVLLLKKIIERGLPQFKKLRKILTFEQIITLPSMEYYNYLLSNEKCIEAIRRKWLPLEEFKAMDLAICTIILNHGYYNKALNSLKKGLINPQFLAGVKSNIHIEINLRHLFSGNAFIAFEEGFIPFERVIQNDSESILLRKLSRESNNKLLKLIRKEEINIAEAIKCETPKALDEIVHTRSCSCLIS